jgi:two-component sensor histidine kinase
MLQSLSAAGEAIDRSLLYVTELLHRVNNDYTKTISFAQTIKMSSPEAKDALCQIVDHLTASAKAYHLLSPRPSGALVDFAEDTTGLCRAMMSSTLDQRGITLHVESPGPIFVDSRRCWLANLILSELITNASRHAFDSRGGLISVSVTVARGAIVCRVSDDGNSSGQPKPGLGTQIIDALTADPSGDIERHYADSGTTIVLSFPKESGPIFPLSDVP